MACIDIKAKDSFVKATASKVKCAAGTSTHDEMIKFIDKSNKHADCPMCDTEESQEHVVLCEKNRKIRDEWIKSMKVKFKEKAKSDGL